MDNNVFDAVHALMPGLNPVLANGYAVDRMQHVEEYLDSVWRQVEKDFPGNKRVLNGKGGLKYLGYRRCTPEEAYRHFTTRGKVSGPITFDISQSSTYMVKYLFELDGQELTDVGYVWLPYVEQGGIMNIKGSKFVISPVMADVGLSVCSDLIFVKWHRAKLTFKKMGGYVNVDGVRTLTDMVYSQVYNVPASRSNGNNATTLTHYLFCRYGVTEAFKKKGIDIIVMDRKDFSSLDYPSDQWTLFTTPNCHSAGRKKSRKGGESNIAIVIPKYHATQEVVSMAACFFYIADLAPDDITLEDYDLSSTWLGQLGKLVLQDNSTKPKILEHMQNHLRSVDGYLDSMALESLRSITETGVKIENIYDLFYYLNANLPRMVATVGNNISSMYGKRLTVLSYVTEDITIGISNILYDLQRESSKPTKKNGLLPADVKDIFKRRLPFDRILALNSGKAFVKSVSSSSDCLIHKVTSAITMQTECGNGTGAKKRPTFGEEQYAHISNIELGGITNLPDRDPTGRSSLNHMALVDPQGTLLRNPILIEELDSVQNDIMRK